MKSKIIAILIFFNLSAFGSYCQIGASCPPCDKELDNLNKANADLTNALTELINANNAYVIADANYTAAAANLDAALIAYNASCPPGSTPGPGCIFLELQIQYCTMIAEGASTILNNAIQNRFNAKQHLTDAKLAVTKAQAAFYACMARPNQLCQKCVNGVIVIDNTFTSPNICEICVKGQSVNNPNPNLHNCEICVDKKLRFVCPPETHQCCDGKCEEKIYDYTFTITITTCAGISPPTIKHLATSNPSSVIPGCVTTGKLFYSFGKCSGGSTVETCFSKPTLRPCRKIIR